MELVGGDQSLSVRIIELKLRRRDLRVILFVLETECPLTLGKTVDEEFERIVGQAVEVAATMDRLEPVPTGVLLLCVEPSKEESFAFDRNVRNDGEADWENSSSLKPTMPALNRKAPITASVKSRMP